MGAATPNYVTTGSGLLQAINRYCAATGVAPTLFGRLAVGDPRLVGDLRLGREPRVGTINRVLSYIAAATDNGTYDAASHASDSPHPPRPAACVQLLAHIESHCHRTGQSFSTFGRLAADDPMLVPTLNRGREPREATRARIMAVIEQGAGL